MRNIFRILLVSWTLPFVILSCGTKEDPTPPAPPVPDTEELVGRLVSIQEYGVLPDNAPDVNRKNLQKAIDEASASGLALYVTPVEDGYPMDGGLVLKKNVSLIGAHGPTGRGTANRKKDGPTGSLFVIRDKKNVFITVESATQIKGIQFYYPEQAWIDPAGVIPYPATIQTAQTSSAFGVTLQNLSFYGEYFAMDFRAPDPYTCEQILFENCYGYPLSGQFIAIDRCYDIPRILHCHVNPSNMREFGRDFSGLIMDRVVKEKTYAYWIDHTDNAVVMDIFTFASYGGIYLGPATYGQFTNFNFDCVTIGIYHAANGALNRSWQIAQGSIIANLGSQISEVHPIVVTGLNGHTALTNVETFTGMNGIPCCVGVSHDFIFLDGELPYTVSLVGCRMWGYAAKEPITVHNNAASLRAVACTDKDGHMFDLAVNPGTPVAPGTVTSFDTCDYAHDWRSSLGQVVVDVENRKEGACCQSITGSGSNILLTRTYLTPVNVRATHELGHLCLWLYVSDVSLLDDSIDGALEVSSSGQYDANEYSWHVSELNLKSGWNFLDLKLSDAMMAGVPNLGNMNFFRLYHNGIKGEITVKIDDIHFYQE